MERAEGGGRLGTGPRSRSPASLSLLPLAETEGQRLHGRCFCLPCLMSLVEQVPPGGQASNLHT